MQFPQTDGPWLLLGVDGSLTIVLVLLGGTRPGTGGVKVEYEPGFEPRYFSIIDGQASDLMSWKRSRTLGSTTIVLRFRLNGAIISVPSSSNDASPMRLRLSVCECPIVLRGFPIAMVYFSIHPATEEKAGATSEVHERELLEPFDATEIHGLDNVLHLAPL